MKQAARAISTLGAIASVTLVLFNLYGVIFNFDINYLFGLGFFGCLAVAFVMMELHFGGVEYVDTGEESA